VDNCPFAIVGKRKILIAEQSGITLEQCLRQTEVKSIKLEVMSIACHRRLPRRWHTERNKDTLSNGDLRAIYKELGFEEWGSAMTKDILIPPS
jgi:hypothetical protein